MTKDKDYNMKYLCEFKEFVITELSIGNLFRSPSRRQMVDMSPRARIMRHNKAELKKYNVTRSLRDPFGHKGIKAGKEAEAAEASKMAASRARKFSNSQPQPKTTRHWFAKPSQNTQPKQPVMKPALNVQPKPFYRKFF
jgi:hypothetical protein